MLLLGLGLCVPVGGRRGFCGRPVVQPGAQVDSLVLAPGRVAGALRPSRRSVIV
jgi:hypothetical protein